MTVDSHAVIERANLNAHVRYAAMITANPAVLERAWQILMVKIASDDATVGERLWLRVLGCQLPRIIHQITADDAYGRLLRSNSPLSLLLGETEGELRRQHWRQAKAQFVAEADEFSQWSRVQGN